MRTATLRLEDMKTTIINMGYVGENEHKQIRFDGKKMFDEYPNASVSLTVCPPAGEAYPATIERDGDFVLWTITDSDLVAEGCGEIQLTFTESPHIAKSYICRTKVLRSLVPTGDIPSGLDDFITRADALLEELEDAIPEGGTTGQVLAKKSNDDFDTEWVDQTGGGGTGDYTDLTNKPQIGGVTLTGNKTLHDLGAATEEAVGAKYTKPSGGIPDTDLASGVQTSLGKADSAYQKPVSGIPASDMASGVIPVLTDLIDDTAGDGDTNKTWSADKLNDVKNEINVLQPTASASDVGKMLKVKTVSNGKVSEYEFGEGGGSGHDVPSGGSTDQVLAKNSGTDYDLKWVTLSGGGTVDDAMSDSSTNPLQNKVITGVVEDLTTLVRSKNIYNKDACGPQDGKTYNTSSGAVQDGSSYAISGKFPVDAETQYMFSTQGLAKVKRVFFFKGSDGGTYMSSTVLDNAAFTTPAQCTYAAVNLFAATHTTEQYNAAIAVAMCEKGAVMTDYVPYSVTREVPTNRLVDGVAVEGAKNYTKVTPLINWYDKSKAQNNKYFNTVYNQIYDSNDYAFSGLIPVKPNTHYNISCDKTLENGKLATSYQEWDASKELIQNTQQNNAFSYISQIHTGANTAYISINIVFTAAHTTETLNAVLNTIMLVEGTQQPLTYTAYNNEPAVDHTKLDNMYQLNLDAFRGKKWLVCGTSVSYQDSHVFTGGLHEDEVCRGYIGNVARRKPMIVTNEGVSGSTLAGSDTYSLINRYQNLNVANYDFITLEYGINDFGSNVVVGTASDAAGTGSFAACLKTIIEYILTENPTVGLIICTDPDVRGTTLNTNNNTLKDYMDVAIAIAEQYRLPVCDWFYKSGINAITKGSTSVDYLTADGTHPSNAGHMRMGAMLNQVFDSLLC